MIKSFVSLCLWTVKFTRVSPFFVSTLELSSVTQSMGSLFATAWTATCQASLSITNSRSLLKFMSIESVMPSNHLILFLPLLLPFHPNIRVFSNASALRIRWPNYWSFSFSISPSSEHSGLILFRINWFDLLILGPNQMTPVNYSWVFPFPRCWLLAFPEGQALLRRTDHPEYLKWFLSPSLCWSPEGILLRYLLILGETGGATAGKPYDIWVPLPLLSSCW